MNEIMVATGLLLMGIGILVGGIGLGIAAILDIYYGYRKDD